MIEHELNREDAKETGTSSDIIAQSHLATSILMYKGSSYLMFFDNTKKFMVMSAETMQSQEYELPDYTIACIIIKDTLIVHCNDGYIYKYDISQNGKPELLANICIDKKSFLLERSVLL